MNSKQRKVTARKTWIKIYEELGSVSKAARRCGIPRSTLYRWINRYKPDDENSLKDKSQKPIKLAKQKITEEIEKLILSIRDQHNFGPQSISTHLVRNHSIKLSPPTVWRVLNRYAVKPLKRYRKHQEIKRYNRPLPGDRVQLDVMKIRAKCYQFTAVDDCTRLRVIRLYPSKHAENTVKFLYEVIENLGFPIQRIQTDWGTEFYNHLNLKDKTLHIEPFLAKWEHFYNHKRPHASLNGKTPYERYLELEKLVPTQGEVTGKYWEKNEVIRPRNYQYLTLIKKIGLSQM